MAEQVERTLPPVRCEVKGCGAMMILLPGHKVVCSASLQHGREWPLPDKEKRAEWRAEQRKVAMEIEVARLPIALRTVYRVATAAGIGQYLHVLLGAQGVTKIGLWFRGSGSGAVEANYGGKKCSFVRAAPEIETQFREVLAGPLAEPTPEAPADGAPTA